MRLDVPNNKNFQQTVHPISSLTFFTTVWTNSADDKLMIFSLIFPENTFRYLTQFVCLLDNLHEMPKLVLWGKNEKNIRRLLNFYPACLAFRNMLLDSPIWAAMLETCPYHINIGCTRSLILCSPIIFSRISKEGKNDVIEEKDLECWRMCSLILTFVVRLQNLWMLPIRHCVKKTR